MPADTKQQILDAAEELFADKGYHCTSLRAITHRAGVNLAAVNYHFGSKEALIEAVMARRLEPLNRLRMEKITAIIDDAKKNGRRPEARQLLHAYIKPLLDSRTAADRSPHVFTLIGRSFFEPDEIVRNTFIRLVAPLIALLFEGLHLALPHLPPAVLFRRLQFALGATAHTLQFIGRPLPQVCPVQPPEPGEDMGDLLLAFITTGMEAPL